jgi:threonyl-tRNA synthetase
MQKPNDQLLPMRHSAEHVLTMVMEKLYGSDEKNNPNIIKAMGPAIADGFYFDFDISESAREKGLKITEQDLPKLEKEMRKLIQQGLLMERAEVSLGVARQIFANNPYKQELLGGLEHAEDFEVSESVNDGKSMVKHQMLERNPEKITLYLTGRSEQIEADKKLLAGLEMMSSKDKASIKLSSFVDLCKGPHVAKISEIKAFNYLASLVLIGEEVKKKNAHSYLWYGFHFASRLGSILANRKMAEERNHRKIGKEMELFAIIPEVGQGLPIWLPNGYAMRRVLEDYMLRWSAVSGTLTF